MLAKLNFYMVYPYLKLHILFNSNGLAISRSGFPDITQITEIIGRHDLVSVRILPNFRLIPDIREMDMV